MRLFVALTPPVEVIEALTSLEWPPAEGLRWTEPSHWHVTLRFLGTVDSADPVVAAVERAVSPLFLEGVAVLAEWVAASVEVVRSRLGGGGPRYETVARVPLIDG